MPRLEPTIAAIATPPGTGGVGIVRLSGPDALTIAEALFRPAGAKRLRDAGGYTGMLGHVFGEDGDLDEAIALVYRSPKSYTGEDVVELSCHGGSWILGEVVRLCVDHGAKPAGPGEFTKRAFLNGKLSLDQAEAVMRLVSAQGGAEMRAALAAKEGALSRSVQSLAQRLTEASAHLAAWADYPEEDLEPVDPRELAETLADLEAKLSALLDSWTQGRILHQGVATVIAGKPNVGKSTLMNLLAGEQRSIVTEIPGTTRDVVEETVQLGNCLLRLSDTAGLRDTDNPVERIGVELARDRLQSADLVLAVFDGAQELDDEDRKLLSQLKNRPALGVVNKSDLPQRLELDELRSALGEPVVLSAGRGEGRRELEAAVSRVVGMEQLDLSAPLVSNQRQRSCILAARGFLREALDALAQSVTLDAINVLMDCALDELLSLTGRKASEEVVNQVFARFCVGK